MEVGEDLYPWGVICSECPPPTIKVSVSAEAAEEYPFLDWACECSEGMYGNECTHCEPGFFMPFASLVPLANCEPCAAGRFSSKGASDCAACMPGRYKRVGGEAACGDCPAHYYQAESNMPNCTQCSSNWFQDQPGKSYCKPLTACIPGKYITSAAIMGEGRCQGCPIGYFQPSVNQHSCIQCPIGKFQNSDSKSFCDEPKSNMVLVQGHSRSDDELTMFTCSCPIGTTCENGLMRYQVHVSQSYMVIYC